MKEIDWEDVKKLYDARRERTALLVNGSNVDIGKSTNGGTKTGSCKSYSQKRLVTIGVWVGAGAAVAAIAIYKEVKKA